MEYCVIHSGNKSHSKFLNVYFTGRHVCPVSFVQTQARSENILSKKEKSFGGGQISY